jgi:glucose/arabinose dehydrogenase
MGRIFSFDPAAANPAATVQDVVVGLPSNLLHVDRHPLSAFAFAPDGALLVNIGAPSDQCLDEGGKPVGPRCAEAEGPNAAGVIRRYAPAGPGRWSPQFTVFANGLRNSMAMATTPTGAMLQVENSIDIADDREPFDEINLLEAGRNYGWPYCMDANKPAPGWAGAHAMDCASAAHTAPAALLPPHSAPLGMSYYSGAMFPGLRGRLLVSLHGYRPTGARILAFDTDARGLPPGKPVDLTPGWLALKGVRPRGRPVGVTVASDGAIWVADDRNGAIIRFAADRPG